ncbi:unnamed protein product [Strongylus vulgaris]|uniref:SXP/RAL-2 family protein Ani s 5-like cation-binding domain-containing protein n=1 Tax=Strongylus vulgaris TaxID=40348 RepID=A0A3P7LIC8_STRVU|nr:unnamed protein product [Strongylus vulgaris]
MLTDCLLICIVVGTVLSGPVYVEELEDLVPEGPDRFELKMLDSDKLMTRSQKQQRLYQILARQPTYIQQAYTAKVQYKQARRAAKAQYKQQIANQRGLGSFQSQMNAIKNDMGISSAEADRRKYELRRQYYTSYPAAAPYIIDD